MRTNIFLLVTVLVLYTSCTGSESQLVQQEMQTKKTIKLNFKDNILSVNPIEAKYVSEQFANNLLYYQLAFGTETDILQYSYDSLRSFHKFIIDTSKVSFNQINQHFKYLLKEKFHVKQVNDFFMAIEGIEKSIWLKSIKNITDSLPDGIKFINSAQFNIESKKNIDSRENILSFFGSPYSFMTDSSFNKPFQLKSSDIDISYEFYRNDKHGIKNVELSFIKNEDQTISDFFNGNIDIISFQPMTTSSIAYKAELKNLVKANYPEYQVNIGNSAIVIYAIFKKILHTPKIDDISKIDSLNKSISVAIENIPVYNKTKYDEMSFTFDFPWHLTIDEAEKSYPNTKYVVISEKVIDYYNGDQNLVLKNIISERNQFEDSIVIQSIHPEYYLSDFTLKGMKDYNKLAILIPQLEFKKPSSY